MPFISKTRLSELEHAERRLEQFDEEDVKASRDNAKALRKQAAELNEKHEDTVENMRKQHKANVRKIETEAESRVETAEAKIKAAERSAAEAEAKVAVLDRRVQTSAQLDEQKVSLDSLKRELDGREKVLAAREKAVTSAEEKFARRAEAHTNEVSKARKEGEEIGEKRGYANGSADMARKIGEITESATKHSQNMGDKALEGVVNAATRDIPQPAVHTLPVTVPAPAPNDKGNKQK